MIPQDWIFALAGGLLIGTAVSLMLLTNGRVTGISGIINGTLSPLKGDTAWRWLFIAGLFAGGVLLRLFYPASIGASLPHAKTWTIILAGLLVGFGTVLGSGCTSGHGVCGISRLSPRSLVATLSFMASGIAAVYLFRLLGVYP